MQVGWQVGLLEKWGQVARPLASIGWGCRLSRALKATTIMVVPSGPAIGFVDFLPAFCLELPAELNDQPLGVLSLML